MITKIFMPESSNSLKSTYIWTVLAGLTYAGSSFAMSMAVSNLLGTYAAGIFAIAMSVGNQLVTIGYYNMRTFQVSDVTEKYSFSDYCASRILTVGAMLLGGAVWLAGGGYTKEKMLIIALMILFKSGEAISDLFEGRYQQKERYDISCRGVFFKTVLYLLCFVLSLLLTNSLLISTAVMAAVYLISIVVIDSRLIPYFGKIRIVFRWNIQRRLMLACFPLFINAFLTTYILNASKYTMDKYCSEELLGMFSVLFMLAFVINLFASFVLKPLISTMSTKYIQGDRKGFVDIMKRQFWIIIGITIVSLIGAYYWGTKVISLLSGMDLSSYRTEVCIMLAGGAFTAIYQLLQYGLVIMRHQYSCLVGCGLTAILTFVITPLLTVRYEIMGAAVSYLCSMVTMSFIFLCFNIYYLKKGE